MSKFKVGYKVRRIEAPNRSGSAQLVQWEVPVGHVDTITHIDECWLRLAGYPQSDAEHDVQKFELAETPFKAGDRVVVINNEGNESWFAVGDVGVVLEADPEYTTYYVNFDAQGNKQVVDDGRWYVDRCDLTLAPPRYSSTFADNRHPEKETKGHVSDSGLQKHSVGTLYPLAIVGYGTEPMIYVLENLETGQVCCCGDGNVRQWTGAGLVHKFAERYELNSSDPATLDCVLDRIIWVSGRPINVDGRLVMPLLARNIVTL